MAGNLINGLDSVIFSVDMLYPLFHYESHYLVIAVAKYRY